MDAVPTFPALRLKRGRMRDGASGVSGAGLDMLGGLGGLEATFPYNSVYLAHIENYRVGWA